MSSLCRMRFVPLLLAISLVVMMALPAASMAAQAPVGVGTASSFGVLAGTTITNTGITKIGGVPGGNIGVSPGSAFADNGTLSLSGAVHLADAVALRAQTDLKTAYLNAANRTPFATVDTELGGTKLTPGVYVPDSPSFGITGTLTLDAQGDPNAVFIFKSPSTLITAAGSNIVLVNGARPCRVFWQVTSSATLGTNSHFVGHLFALTSIAAQTGATVTGQLLARNGAVTLDSNVITNVQCATAPGSTATSDTVGSEETPTINGGELPKTASPWYNLLLAGVGLTFLGVVGLKNRKTHA